VVHEPRADVILDFGEWRHCTRRCAAKSETDYKFHRFIK
jgi:hypothetical protein